MVVQIAGEMPSLISELCIPDSEGRTPLIVAAEARAFAACSAILSCVAGAVALHQDNRGYTVVHCIRTRVRACVSVC